jgi:hypothetical protein
MLQCIIPEFAWRKSMKLNSVISHSYGKPSCWERLTCRVSSHPLILRQLMNSRTSAFFPVNIIQIRGLI